MPSISSRPCHSFDRRIPAGSKRPSRATHVLYRMPPELLLFHETGDLAWWAITTLDDYVIGPELYPVSNFYDNGFDETGLIRITATELGFPVWLQPFTAYLRWDAFGDWQPQQSYWVTRGEEK
jgi:hypothetical protein